MTLLLVALAVLVVSGLTALIVRRSAVWATAFGVGGCVIGCALGLVPAVQILISGVAESGSWSWSMPAGSLSLKLDALSAFFLLPILGVSLLAAIYGGKYMMAYRERKALGGSWFFYNILVASMALLVLAHNALLFLVAWEVMSLSSFFLVTFENEKRSAREAGWIYLVATHLGTAFLLAMFCLLGAQSGSLDFDTFGAIAGMSPLMAGLLYVFALLGFGTKAGFMPMHVWLPEAHPAAPSHVSAVMSGVMIKTGIYGLVRTLTFLGEPAPWWGWVLVGIGVTSGVLGVVFALAQHDIKRLLAYHSVENIGIIALGLGVGLVGVSCGSPLLATLGFAGGLLHVLNHAVFKGLLFLGAGSVLHGAGTGEIDHLGGLSKRMPWTSFAFLVGAVAICGLPPLNGFVSEFLVYFASFKGGLANGIASSVPALAAIGALALIGGLAAACFTKAFGIIFLGEPRSEHAAHAHEVGWAMRLPMLVLAAACVIIGLLSPWIVTRMNAPLACLPWLQAGRTAASLDSSTGALIVFVLAACGLIALVGLLALLRRSLLAKREVGVSGTWDCGYAQPTARMQYTASSYAQPITDFFSIVLRTKRRLSAPKGLFPDSASLATQTPDVFTERLYRATFGATSWALSRLQGLQHGRVHLYVLYIVLMLLILLLWKL